MSLLTKSVLFVMSLCAVSFAQQVATVEPPAPAIETPSAVTPRQQEWLRATLERRIDLAEQLGEEGGRAIAQKLNLQPLFDGTGRGLPQGPDQVYRASDGATHVFECKGGSSQTGQAYGHLQGTPEWAVKSAERVLRSTKATAVEKQAAQAVLEAAARGNLQVHVVRTSHVLGEPTAAVVEQSVKCSEQATKMAQSILDDLARAAGRLTQAAGETAEAASSAGKAGAAAAEDAARTGAALAEDTAQATRGASKLAAVGRGVSKVAVPVAVVIDAGLRVSLGMQTEQKFANGEINQQQREVEHAKNVAGMTGGWTGAFIGAKLGGAGGAAAGSCVAPGPGTAIGGGLGAVAGGVVGYFGGEAAAEAAAEWTVSKVHQAGTTLAEAGGKAVDGVKGAAQWTGEKAGQAGQAISSGASGAWDGTKAAGQWVGGKTSQAWGWLHGN